MAARELHLVPPAAQASRAESDLGDLALTAFLFALGALPVACDLAGIGRWSGGSLGLGTAGALLSGRELLGWLRVRARRGAAITSARAGGPAAPGHPPRA